MNEPRLTDYMKLFAGIHHRFLLVTHTPTLQEWLWQ